MTETTTTTRRPILYWLDAARVPSLAILTDDELRACYTSASDRATELEYTHGPTLGKDDTDSPAAEELVEAEVLLDRIGDELDRRAEQSNHERITEAGRYSREPSTHTDEDPYYL